MSHEDPALARCGQSVFNRFYFDGENGILLIHHRGRLLVLPVEQPPAAITPPPEPTQHPAMIIMGYAGFALFALSCWGGIGYLLWQVAR